MCLTIFSKNRMKTPVFIACLCVVVYATNPEVVTHIHDTVAKCSEELNKQPTESETIHCLLRKENVIDEQGKFILEKGLDILDEIISDETKRNQAKETVHKCYDEMTYGIEPEINEEETIKGIQCASPILALLYKSE